MARHSFQPRNSLFPCFSLHFPTLRALLREISPFTFPALPFLHCVKVFPIRLFPFFILCSTFLFPLISFPPFVHPSLFAPSPTFFLIPPHFSIFLPNKRTIARPLAHYARARTPAPTRTSGGFRFFPSPLHTPSQSTGHQCVRGEEKREKAFTEHTTISESTSYHKHPISSTVNFISSLR